MRHNRKFGSAVKFSFPHPQRRDHCSGEALTQVLPKDRVIPPLVVKPCGVSDESGGHNGETSECDLSVGRHFRGILGYRQATVELVTAQRDELCDCADDDTVHAWETTMPTKRSSRDRGQGLNSPF